MPSAQGVRDLLVPHLMGRLDSSGSTLEVTDLEVIEEGRKFTVVFELTAQGERWRVRIPCDSSEMGIFDGNPPYDLIRYTATMLHIRLFEWWQTKGSERQAAKQGERID
ncbi:hypothetical protein [Streptomyces sp. NPDC048248]|uniref:hypothetical protein n=1 Tax=Streptomyces sp. NPDC048248 TaxID=3365523 RepID=UPI00371489AD